MRVVGVEQEPVKFAEFYKSSCDDCLRIVLLNVGDRQLAEDLVAEPYARAWISWRKVRALEVPRACCTTRPRCSARCAPTVSRPA